MGARELLDTFQRDVWFPLVLRRRHDIKQLDTLVSSFDGVIEPNTTTREFDDRIEKYENVIIQYVTFVIRKDPTLKRSLFAAMNESVPLAQQQSSSVRQDLW